MAYFDISENDIKSLEGKIAIITGASSGIGLATTKLFLSKGAAVVGGDLQEPAEPIESSKFAFHRTDVTSWHALCDLFARAQKDHGHIDIVFANAGIGPKADYFKLQTGEDGALIEPSTRTLDINLGAVANQAALALHYMQRQDSKGGSIVLTASCTGYQRFGIPDYVAAKHGVIGLLRSMYTQLDGKGVRINAVAPSWTRSGLVQLPDSEFEALDLKCQGAEAVARSVGLLVTDQSRHGQCLYSYGGRYVEMEGPLQETMLKAIGKEGDWYEEPQRLKVMERGAELAAKQAK